MITLPTKKVTATSVNPTLLTLYGPPKVGKSTMLAELPNCLIIDTEKGTSKIDAMKIEVNNLTELVEVIKELKGSKHKYEYIALDPIDAISLWYEAAVCREAKVKTLVEMPYGAGFSIAREKVMNVINVLRTITPHVIVIGHLKKTLLGSETDIQVNISSLDLTGKLKNLIMADSDAIGLVHRSPEGELMVSFQGNDQIEVGSRCKHLQNALFPFDWKNIYI
ncbi:MAG TPA: hypothetical protein DCL77_01660 [Prolixibacteraceae bacterium]|jgi:hypothetical protein|nr:hypothetical protein [Prolixibacteraceae bacterium]